MVFYWITKLAGTNCTRYSWLGIAAGRSIENKSSYIGVREGIWWKDASRRAERSHVYHPLHCLVDRLHPFCLLLVISLCSVNEFNIVMFSQSFSVEGSNTICRLKKIM